MQTRTPTAHVDLSERLRLTLQHRSEAAASLLYTLCHSATAQGLNLFLVGGLVRDLLLAEPQQPSAALGDGLDIHLDIDLDIDLAVDGDPAALHTVLAEAAGVRPTIHDRFGTASVSLAEGVRVDLARTRSERYPAPAALPIVAPAPIEVDLRRRDFTINAAAVALTGERAGQLLDPHGAVGDLERRLIRTLHPDSFRDDPTRLVRAARYAARIGGTIERRTWSDARRDRGRLAALSPGRFGNAWRRLLLEPDPPAALRIARRLKLPQSRESDWVVPQATLAAAATPEHFWASIGLLDADLEAEERLPRAVGMNRREHGALAAGARLRLARRRLGGLRRRSARAALLQPFPVSVLEAAQCIWNGASGAAVSDYLEHRDSVRSPISAQRLLALGLPQGPELSRWLAEIEAAIWDGELAPSDPASVARMEQRIRLRR